MKSIRFGAWGVVLAFLVVGCVGCASANSPGGEDAGGNPPPPPGDPDAAAAIVPDADSSADTPDSGEVVVPDATPSGGTPDAAPTGACNLVTGAGCSGAMPACDLGAANAHVCRAVLAQGMNTSTCNDPTSCAAGYTCVGASASQSSCMRYCGGDTDCGGGAGALCVVTLNDGTGQIPGVTLCTQSCGPLDASGCPSTWGCRIGREPAGSMRPVTTCEPAGAGGRNATCSTSADCQAGFQCFCTDAACTPALQKCKKLCNATDNIGCPAGSTCQGLNLVIGGKAWGACP